MEVLEHCGSQCARSGLAPVQSLRLLVEMAHHGPPHLMPQPSRHVCGFGVVCASASAVAGLGARERHCGHIACPPGPARGGEVAGPEPTALMHPLTL
ncbi:unnamed protein product [Rangifer tarandus platyrhynchus]|uniref:Uncharacterized protein n=2 Tax=Rangifer tarandus platyrhynchus TaxID=3082113 RepID=A0ACB0E515_RANTA|nr:unnamed protein product [Rangifer tarandus platyrhynchus]CAI9695576.1 unnamed protein product [Rangifer tarandus platyrhynchus]